MHDRHSATEPWLPLSSNYTRNNRLIYILNAHFRQRHPLQRNWYLLQMLPAVITENHATLFVLNTPAILLLYINQGYFEKYTLKSSIHKFTNQQFFQLLYDTNTKPFFNTAFLLKYRNSIGKQRSSKLLYFKLGSLMLLMVILSDGNIKSRKVWCVSNCKIAISPYILNPFLELKFIWPKAKELKEWGDVNLLLC